MFSVQNTMDLELNSPGSLVDQVQANDMLAPVVKSGNFPLLSRVIKSMYSYRPEQLDELRTWFNDFKRS